MNLTPTREALELTKAALTELESAKGSVAAAVQRLLRASTLLGDDGLRIWCEIQLGDSALTQPLRDFVEHYIAREKNPKDKKATKGLDQAKQQAKELGINLSALIAEGDLSHKATKSSGGFAGIGFIEERYADLVRTKSGNDGTHYKLNLNQHINFVRKGAHTRATQLFSRLAFTDSPQTVMDVLKSEVEDRLLEIDPEQAERVMVAFRRAASDSPEEWSQAVTTCRRFIEALADQLFAPTGEVRNGRMLGPTQHINRLWAFMDDAISSESNRELAKSHVDFLGNYLQRLYRLTNKGVHTTLQRHEVIKAVLHTYLLTADLLSYLTAPTENQPGLPNIHTASLDVLESVLGVNRAIAKEIVKLRVAYPVVTPELLGQIRGVGPKTLSKAKDALSFTPVARA